MVSDLWLENVKIAFLACHPPQKKYIHTTMNIDTDYICDVMKNLINQLKERNIPITECRMSDYHFHEYYIRVNANPEIIKTLHFEGAKIVKNSIVCDCHWSIMKFKEETSH